MKASVRGGTVRIGAVGRPTEEGPLPIHDVTFPVDDATFPVDRVTFPIDHVTFLIDGVTTPSRRRFCTLLLWRRCDLRRKLPAMRPIPLVAYLSFAGSIASSSCGGTVASSGDANGPRLVAAQ